ncbi:hypothetical protein D1BOALGB6SA_9866 [Olavius sp. associated proteobacterium Delta 1]|nr:hypothetical protein D1BOALGB6SA_9866 [Olavius sp. associated proteobacterium Delta 1]
MTASLFSGFIKFKKGSFAADVITLFKGNFTVHLLTIAVSPILSRFYMREQFGAYGLYLSICTIYGGLASWQYFQAIMLPAEDEEAIHVVVLSEIVLAGMSLVSLLLIFFWNHQIAEIFNVPMLGQWLWLIPLSVLFIGINDVLNCWFSRKKNFSFLVSTRIANSATQNGIKTLLGFLKFLKSGGLILGLLTGQLIEAIILIKKFWRNNKDLFLISLNPATLKKAAKRYSKFPKYQSWAVLLNRLSTHMPIILLGYFFSPAVVGQYFLSHRILGIPISIFGRSVAGVFFQRLSAYATDNTDSRVFLFKTFLGLIAIGIIPLLIIGLFGPRLFSFIFGEIWFEAGQYVQILSPFYFLMFIVSPLSTALIVSEKQEFILMIQLLFLTLSFISLMIGGLSGSVKLALTLFSIGGSLRYLFELLLCFRFSQVQ